MGVGTGLSLARISGSKDSTSEFLPARGTGSPRSGCVGHSMGGHRRIRSGDQSVVFGRRALFSISVDGVADGGIRSGGSAGGHHLFDVQHNGL